MSDIIDVCNDLKNFGFSVYSGDYAWHARNKPKLDNYSNEYSKIIYSSVFKKDLNILEFFINLISFDIETYYVSEGEIYHRNQNLFDYDFFAEAYFYILNEYKKNEKIEISNDGLSPEMMFFENLKDSKLKKNQAFVLKSLEYLIKKESFNLKNKNQKDLIDYISNCNFSFLSNTKKEIFKRYISYLNVLDLNRDIYVGLAQNRSIIELIKKDLSQEMRNTLIANINVSNYKNKDIKDIQELINFFQNSEEKKYFAQNIFKNIDFKNSKFDPQTQSLLAKFILSNIYLKDKEQLTICLFLNEDDKKELFSSIVFNNNKLINNPEVLYKLSQEIPLNISFLDFDGKKQYNKFKESVEKQFQNYNTKSQAEKVEILTSNNNEIEKIAFLANELDIDFDFEKIISFYDYLKTKDDIKLEDLNLNHYLEALKNLKSIGEAQKLIQSENSLLDNEISNMKDSLFVLEENMQNYCLQIIEKSKTSLEVHKKVISAKK